MKTTNSILLTGLLAASLVLPGCATKDYVNEQVGGVGKRADGMETDIGRLDAQGKEFDARIAKNKQDMDGISQTAQDALTRADAAGKLAQGKFLYEVALSSNVSFKVDSAVLTPAARTALDEFSDQLKADNKNVYVEIQGHTDNRGSKAANLLLGQKRAEAVQYYLATKGGLPLHRMNVISYGESAPLTDNRTRAHRAENRRVMLVVLQ
jgi:outer membrane protein OmpA-like peptidoglycan-associated protein